MWFSLFFFLSFLRDGDDNDEIWKLIWRENSSYFKRPITCVCVCAALYSLVMSSTRYCLNAILIMCAKGITITRCKFTLLGFIMLDFVSGPLQWLYICIFMSWCILFQWKLEFYIVRNHFLEFYSVLSFASLV